MRKLRQFELQILAGQDRALKNPQDENPDVRCSHCKNGELTTHANSIMLRRQRVLKAGMVDGYGIDMIMLS